MTSNFSRLARLPRRLLMTADTLGGVWNYALQLARGLGRCNIPVTLATMGGPVQPDQARAAAAIPSLELYESHYKLEWMPEPWVDLAAAGEWLLELEARVRPDLVHLNSFSHGSQDWQAPTLMVGHSCVLSWWQAVEPGKAPAALERYRQAVHRGLHAADLVVAPTRAMLSSLQLHYGPFQAARVIFNGRDPEQFKPGAKEPVILSAGRLWDKGKNISLLAEIAPRLQWPVHVAGETRGPAGAVPLPAAVRWLGRLPEVDLELAYERSAIYACPARYEPFGLCALEAGLAGCALVLSDIPSLREIWDGAALFVREEDPDAWCHALNALICQEERRTCLAHQARRRALEFNTQRMVSGYLSAYSAVLESATREVACAL